MSDGKYKDINEIKIGDEILSMGNKTSTIKCIIKNGIFKKIKMCKLKNKKFKNR